MSRGIRASAFILLSTISCIGFSQTHGEYIEIARDNSVASGFVTQITQVVGQENVNSWKVSCGDGPAQRGVDGFKMILRKNCNRISASGNAKTKIGLVSMTMSITRSGSNPLTFKITIVAKKDLGIKVITKTVSDSFSIPANATPEQSMNTIRSSFATLKKSGASAKNTKSPSTPLWKWVDSLFLPQAYSEEILNLEDVSFDTALHVGELFLYTSTFTAFKEVYQAKDIRSFEEKILQEFSIKSP